jgi:hypothetical protein
MKEAPVYRDAESACRRVGRSAQAAGTFLAGLCLVLSATFAAIMPASFENRIVYFLFVGLVPSLASYVSGLILRHILGLSCRFCEIILTRGARLVARVANNPAIYLCYRHIHKMVFRFGCLLIRGAARFLIKMQLSASR